MAYCWSQTQHHWYFHTLFVHPQRWWQKLKAGLCDPPRHSSTFSKQIAQCQTEPCIEISEHERSQFPNLRGKTLFEPLECCYQSELTVQGWMNWGSDMGKECHYGQISSIDSLQGQIVECSLYSASNIAPILITVLFLAHGCSDCTSNVFSLGCFARMS